MSKKVYTIDPNTFVVDTHSYKDVVSYYKNIFGENYIVYKDDYYFRLPCTETEYYFSRKIAIKKANQLLKEYVWSNESDMERAMDDYFTARNNFEKYSGKVIK